MKQKEIIFYLVGKKFKKSPNAFVPFDESMVNRGRSIFDAILINNGVFIDIDSHLERTYSATKILGTPLEEIFSREEFKKQLEQIKSTVLKQYDKNLFFKLEIIASKQANIFLRFIPLSLEWHNEKQNLVMIAIQYKYLLQDLKYCGRYAEPMIIAELAKKQIDPEIQECLFYSKIEKNNKVKYMTLEATNSSFCVIDTKNRLWVAEKPNVLPSTSLKLVKKIAEEDMCDITIPKKERISEVIPLGFPINTPGYKIKEIFSSGAVRSIVPVKKLIFVDVKNEESETKILRTKGKKDVIIKNESPITNRLKKRFQEEIQSFK